MGPIKLYSMPADLPQGGLEIPCILTFEGTGKDIQNVRKLVAAALPLTSSCTDEELSIKISSVEGDNIGETQLDTNEWVQCGYVILTNHDRQILTTGQIST